MEMYPAIANAEVVSSPPTTSAVASEPFHSNREPVPQVYPVIPLLPPQGYAPVTNNQCSVQYPSTQIPPSYVGSSSPPASPAGATPGVEFDYPPAYPGGQYPQSQQNQSSSGIYQFGRQLTQGHPNIVFEARQPSGDPHLKRQKPPNAHFFLSLVSCGILFTIGFLAVYFSCKAMNAIRRNDYEAAKKYGRRAKWVAIISITVGITIYIVSTVTSIVVSYT